MKIIIISMMNRLLSGAIMKYLRERGELMPIRISNPITKDESYKSCKSHNADIILMEIGKVSPFNFNESMDTAKKIRQTLPKCKIVFLCDEDADPDTAESVKDVKKLGYIDGFFYSSVSGEYLSAMLDAL